MKPHERKEEKGMQTRKEKRKSVLRAVLRAWGVILACLLMVLFVRNNRVVAEQEAAQTYEIGSAEDFYTYSKAYANGFRNPNDVLNISIQSGLTITDQTFFSLGTEDRPFAGTLNIPASGIDVFHLFECPLFDYVSTDMTITAGRTVKIMREAITETPESGILTSGALFANHVVAGSGAATWSVSLLPLSEGTEAASFEGLIGDIEDGATVNVTFTNTADLAISGPGHIGTICGQLGDGATLNVTTAGSGSALAVSSSGGHAGGVVGIMGENAVLTLKSTNNTRVNSVSTTAGYAGGIVGYVSGVTTGNGIKLGAGITDYPVTGSVTGTSGAGALFGYYLSDVDNCTFTLLNTYSIASGMTVTSTGNTGGVFGYLVNRGNSFAFDGNASGGETFNVRLSAGSARGGVAGKFATNALNKVLSFSNTSVTLTANSSSKTGGLIGQITSAPAYVSISGVSVTSSGTSSGNAPGGGLVGDAGTDGSFIDVSGNVTISGRFFSGLVGALSDGVLRIAGTTDLSAFNYADSTSCSIVRTHGRSLIYALGSGENAGWTLKRNTSSPNRIDDVGTWGEVVRLDGTKLTAESDLFTVNMTAHTVTVKSGVTTMANAVDFAKTALNIQLNTAVGKGALLFQTATQSATLLAADLEFGNDINLTGTGILGFTRNDEKTVNKVLMPVTDPFTGTLDGNGHTLTVAVGEVWGLTSAGAALPGGSTDGYIRRHKYLGLFAGTSGASISDLTLAGYYQILQDVDPMYVGGLCAQAKNGLTLTDVTVTGLTIDNTLSSDYVSYMGGAIGQATDNSLDISVTGGVYRPTINDRTGSGVTGASKFAYAGGVIGYVADGTGQSIAFDGATIGLTYTKTVNTARESVFGSAIAATSDQTYPSKARTIDLSDVTVKMSATGTVNNRIMGGILGTAWLSANVTLDGVEINSATIVQSDSDAADFGGLVQKATGHWDVRDLSVTAANFNVKATGSTFGFLTNKSSTTLAALYLELDNTGTNYDIGAVTFTGSTGTFSAFDEIVADTRYGARDIVRNGNSVVSIKTSGNVIDTSGSYNTYLNKTAYGQSANGATNEYARYYYNVGYAVTNIATAKYNLYAWSVKQYAHSSISAWFGNPSSTFAGEIDLTGISYYPVDLSSDVTFSAATVTLDNITMEANAKYAYSGEAGTRSTRSVSQHYLMHVALFLNATGDITSTGSPTGLKLRGNVPKISNGICGFLVAGTLGGTDNPTPTTLDLTNLILDGVYISNGNAHFADTTYAPLLVNVVGRNATVEIDGATQTGYSGSLAGSSLIGDVGTATARGINLTFSRIVLDGRNNVSTDLLAATTASLYGVYGTSKSIFSRATLLNSFLYAGESAGSYNFTLEEDWDSSTPVHHVTYGYEITTSVEHAGKQNKYSGSATVYTDPDIHNETSDPYDFTTYFQRYVYVAAVPAEHKHELTVNITFSGEITGTGKYDDPFQIDTGEKLDLIAKIIKGDDVTSSVKITLPSDLTSYNYTATGYTPYLYSFGSTNYSSTAPGAPAVTNANARRYLAGAYYAIDDITLPNGYTALGQTTGSNPEYAFHGVLIGSGNSVRTITNVSDQPLVHSSNGCVIKNLAVHVATTDEKDSHVINLESDVTTYQYSGGQASYGALIRQILGGDNFIDNVKVSFETSVGNAVTFTFNPTEDNKARLMPIGGYVGTLVNGGLIFRNMEEDSDDDGVFEPFVGLTAATSAAVSDPGYLYVNPIIGRVIAGYAFCEADDYAVSSAFSNGTKNYAMSDLNPALAKLSIANSNNRYTITVPNGQAMYVLGAIVNSGAASAAYNASTEQAYATLPDFWQAYRAWTATRSGATYDGVGTSSGADYTAAQADAYDSAGTLKGIPYIIRTYTAKNGNVYYARALTQRTNNIISVTGDCDVAAGFRGIGSLYYESTTSYAADRVHLAIESMAGVGNPTITLHMSFAEYDASVTSYRAANGSERTADPKYELDVKFGSNAGYGLFNRLYMTGGTGYIEGFTLSGDVVYTVRVESSGEPLTCSFSNVKEYSILNVGALTGIVYTANSSTFLAPLRVRNVSLSALTVEGPKYAGGLTGALFTPLNGNNANYTSYITNCSASGLTVRAGKAAGGYVGYVNVGGNLSSANSARLLISGDSTLVDGVSRKTTVALTAISVFGPETDWVERVTSAAGGLIGCADVAFHAAGSVNDYLVIQHIKVVGGTVSALRSTTTDIDNKSKMGLPSAGGIVGKIRASKTAVSDCEILHVNLDADVTGGVLGSSVITKLSSYKFERILVDGDKGDSTSATMTARVYAGGAVGHFYAKQGVTFPLTDVAVRNYSITSEYTGNRGAAGGVIGSAFVTDNTSIERSFIFRNIEVTGCTLTANTTSGGASNRKGIGGLCGVMSGVNSKTTYYGYNILINVTFAGSGTGNAGAIVGNNVSGNLGIVKLVGVSTVVDPGTKTLTRTELNGTGSYTVHSDFSQAQTNTVFSGINDAGTAADDCTNVASANPYATANPAYTLGSTVMVGEGFADSVANLPIQAILADGIGGRYAYAASAYYTGNSGDTNYAAFNSVKATALSMFSEETLGYDGTDFPILLIETADENASHKLINSYIRLLTNTRFDYGSTSAPEFDVVIYNMAYSEGEFTFTTGNASLRLRNGKFLMVNTAYDSGKLQCSLVDVRFYDPSGTGAVVYHLYVPVFIKKVLTFDFDIAALGSTTYLESQYTSRFGYRLISNVGAPITLYFRYTYSRFASEWENAINAGENPHRHYGKELVLQKANNNAVLKNFDGDTILVLVDKNDGGRPYYARLGDALSGTDDDQTRTLDLTAFRTGMTRDGENLVFSGDYFTPLDLADMLTLTVASEGDGRTMVECDALEATVTVNGQGYRPATEEELEAGEVDLFRILVGAIEGDTLTESYYLSVFTEGGADYEFFHYFIVTSPSALFDGVTYPARISDTDPHTMVHLVMGKIFDHTNLTISSASKRGLLLMTSGDNDAITTTLSVRIGISSDLGEELRNEVKGYVSATGFYQSFLLYLTRHEGNAQSKAILGNPTATGSYETDYTLNGTADNALTAYANDHIHVTQSFAEFVTGNLGSAFAGENFTVEVNASVTLTYELDGAVAVQFPGRNGEDENGVTLSASSNIAFSDTATSYSKNSISRDEYPPRSYYSEADIENATLFCEPFGDNRGDFTPFGINALNDPPETLEILPTLNFTPVINQVRGQYADAVVMVTLRQKQASGLYGNADLADISQYITSLSVGGDAATATDHPSYYSVVVDAEDLIEGDVTIEFPRISFSVETGAPFEDAGLSSNVYSNYRLTVAIVLRDGSGNEIAVSKCSDYVIYTNAKVVPSFIPPSAQQ